MEDTNELDNLIKKMHKLEEDRAVAKLVEDYYNMASLFALRLAASTTALAISQSDPSRGYEQELERILNESVNAWSNHVDSMMNTPTLKQAVEAHKAATGEDPAANIKRRADTRIRSSLGLTPTAENLDQLFKLD